MFLFIILLQNESGVKWSINIRSANEHALECDQLEYYIMSRFLVILVLEVDGIKKHPVLLNSILQSNRRWVRE